MALTSSPTSTDSNNNADVEMPAEIAATLAKVDRFLRDGLYQQALAFLGRSKMDSSWMRNAVGVCQLRLGQTQAALTMFRGLVVSEALVMCEDAPIVFKTNYAVALLETRNISGCLAVLAEIKNESHPAVQRLRLAIKRWKDSLSLWQKIQWYTGTDMDHPVNLGFAPGDLT